MADLQHHLCTLMQDNKLFLCPAGKDKQLHQVLDVVRAGISPSSDHQSSLYCSLKSYLIDTGNVGYSPSSHHPRPKVAPAKGRDRHLGCWFRYVLIHWVVRYGWVQLTSRAIVADEHPESEVRFVQYKDKIRAALKFAGTGYRSISNTSKQSSILLTCTESEVFTMLTYESHPCNTPFIQNPTWRQASDVELIPLSLPPNLTFQIDDLEEHWDFTHTFDFIYSRTMTGSISKWPAFSTKHSSKLLQQTNETLSINATQPG